MLEGCNVIKALCGHRILSKNLENVIPVDNHWQCESWDSVIMITSECTGVLRKQQERFTRTYQKKHAR